MLRAKRVSFLGFRLDGVPLRDPVPLNVRDAVGVRVTIIFCLFSIGWFISIFTLSAFGQGVGEAWVARYNGPGNSSDAATAMAIDNSGNLYVTGYSIGSGTYYDYATIKYSSFGDTLWVRRYNGPGNDLDQAFDLAVDDSGNVYVTGVSVGSATSYDYATIKYSSSGDTLWVRRYNGPGNLGDGASALAVDDSGNLYVTGWSYDSVTSLDYATIKYSSAGDTLWVRRYNGPGNDYDEATALAVDASGKVYVKGVSYGGGGTYYDYATIKYSSSGDTLWVRRYNGPGNGFDYATALAVDDSGNLYVTGESYGIGTLDDYATIKYSSAGDTLWVRRYNGPGNFDDEANALAVDNSGNVYVTGVADYSCTFGDCYGDYATIKYAPNGDTLWVRRYNGPGNSADEATAMAGDDSGNVYVTGRSVVSGFNFDYATIKYSSAGDTLWVRRYNGPGNGEDGARALAVDGSGNVYVTGRSIGTIYPDYDYATIKYSPCVKAGDANGDNKILLSDIITIINFLFKSQPAPSPLCRGDANADGKVLLPDIIYLINFLFKSGPAPLKSGLCCL